MFGAALAGFGTGVSLILAIGAQNAFVLRQGLAGTHVLGVCLVCALSDAVLITAGVAGVGTLIAGLPWLERALRWGGAAFLIWYGAGRMRAALAPGALATGAARPAPLGPTLATAMAITRLNPHVYLDTRALIGAVSAGFAAGGPRVAFGAGAVAASFAFFFALGYGARRLAPVFARPAAWARLDAGVALVMWTIAAALLLG